MLEYEVNPGIVGEKLCWVANPHESCTHWSLLDSNKHYLVCMTSWEKALGYSEHWESLTKMTMLGSSIWKDKVNKKERNEDKMMINRTKSQEFYETREIIHQLRMCTAPWGPKFVFQHFYQGPHNCLSLLIHELCCLWSPQVHTLFTDTHMKT